MSLLMDALRRAEEEKKRQAANAAPAARVPLAETEDAAHVAEEPDDAETVAEEGDVSAEFSLENDDDFIAGALDDLDRSHSMALPAGLALEPLEKLDDSSDGYGAQRGGADDLDATNFTERPRSEQTQTMPSSRAVERDLNAYFEQSQSMEIPRGQSAGDITLEDVAAHTVVSAQTVFAATERPRPKRWLLLAAVMAAVMVVGIGVVGIIYAQRNPEPRYLPPPTVADGVERPQPRELPVVPLETVGSDPVQTAVTRIDTRVAPGPPPAAVPQAEAARSVVASSTAATPEPRTATSATPAPPVTAASASLTNSTAAPVAEPDLSEPAVRAPAPVAQSTPAPPPPGRTARAEVGVAAGELRIARAVTPAHVDSQVAAAYAAFSSGQLAAAAAQYKAVLATRPGQRDALLGVAAVALAGGDTARAYHGYRAVLREYPDDPVATAALLGLTADQDGNRAARLRVMLDEYPDAPFLHFALGNWYARQARWGDAQQAYFDAWRLDRNNADYAFNLAVSLDQMGQGKAALEYYREALTLADNASTGFNSAAVLERIKALSPASGE